jgi:hypothetical protein
MGIDITSLAPAAGTGAGCPSGPGSPTSRSADDSFERLVERASDVPAAAESTSSTAPNESQSAPRADPAPRTDPTPGADAAPRTDVAPRTDPTPAADQAAGQAIPRQPTQAEAHAGRRFDVGRLSSLGDEDATDESVAGGRNEDPWAAVLPGAAIAGNPAQCPPIPTQDAEIGGFGTTGDGSLDEKAPGGAVGSSRTDARPPQTVNSMAAPALDSNAEAAAADPNAVGWANRAKQEILAGNSRPTPVSTAAGSDPAASGDVERPAGPAAQTPPCRPDLAQSSLQSALGAAIAEPGRTDAPPDTASRLAARTMLERALTTDSAQRTESAERLDGESAAASTPGLVDLPQVPADEAVRRYVDLLASQAPMQREAKPVDSPAPRGEKDAAAGDFVRAFPFVAPAAVPAAAGAPATAEAAPAATPAEVHLTPQIVKAVSLLWRDGVGEARLRLEPEHLGSVTVSLRVERGIVTARLTADVPAVRDWIRTHEADLRSGLASQGLELDQIVVSADPDARGRQSPPDSNSQPRTPRTSRGGPQFELNA